MDSKCPLSALCASVVNDQSPQRHRVRRGNAELSEYIPVMCPYCGETSELTFEDEGWSRQSYVQDCPVCCQPWQVDLVRDADGDVGGVS